MSKHIMDSNNWRNLTCGTCGHDTHDNDGETHTTSGDEGSCRLCDDGEPCGLYR